MNALGALLAFIVVYMPYQTHYEVVLPVKGLNLMNLLFLVTLAAVLLRRERAKEAAPLKWRFILVMAALAWGFVIGQVYDDSQLAEDFTALKEGIFYLLFYFLFYHAVRDLRTIRLLFGAILFVTFLVSVQCVRQGLDYGIGDFTWTHRASGPFATYYVGANQAAAYLVIFVPLFLAVWLTCKSRPVARLLSLPALATGIPALLFTFSRQGYAIMALQFLFQALRRNKVLALLLAAALLSYESWAPAGVVERIQMTEQEQPEAGGNARSEKLDKSTESRFDLWGGAMELLKRRPWGLGLNHFKREIGAYVPEYASMDAHNGFVLLTVETGIAGLAAIAWLLAGLFGLARKVEKLDGSEDSQLLGGGFLVALGGAAAVNLFGSRLLEGPVMGNFWILAALVARYYTLRLQAAKAAP